MARGSTAMGLEEVLQFPLRGEGWGERLAVGMGLLLASIVVPFIPAVFVYGYLVRIMRAAIERGELELSAWKDWGGLFTEGLKAFFVGFTYLLPGLGLMLLGTGVYCAATVALSAVSETAGTTTESLDFFVFAFLAALVIFFLSLAFGTFFTLLGALPLPAAAANMAAEMRLSAAYRLRHVARSIAANPMGYFAAWVVFSGLLAMMYVVMTFAYYTLVLACFIPILVIPPAFYALLVAAGQFGLAYRKSQSLLAGGSDAGS